MPVFSKNGKHILYIHVPKTGGTSIGHFFWRNGFAVHYCDHGGPDSLNKFRYCSPQHMHAEMIYHQFKLDRFDARFMTVRDPYDRFRSEYVYQNEGVDRMPVDDWALHVLEEYERTTFFLDNHVRPQREFWIPDCGVYRIEDGLDAEWIKKISRLIDEDLVGSVPVLQRSSDRATNVDVSPDVWRKVESIYLEDYKKFGYPRRPDMEGENAKEPRSS